MSSVETVPDWRVRSPVAFLIFNRPDTTARVFAAIRAARPARLLVVADGPRANVASDAERCAAARAVTEGVDWDCEVLTHYADTNMGCKRRVASGLDWVFDTVAEAIVLEDDCLPHPSFFRYCDELLERYRDDERLMAITGDNLLVGGQRTNASYYFSLFSGIWGWATWRRAWQHFDLEMRSWPTVRDGGWLLDMLHASGAARFWARKFELCHLGRIDTWDYPWQFACWLQHGLVATPAVNLVTNLGFGPGATHTSGASGSLTVPSQAISFPLRHPGFVVRDSRADAAFQALSTAGDGGRFKVYARDTIERIRLLAAQVGRENR